MLSELQFVQENDRPEVSHTVPVVYLENKRRKAKGYGYSQQPVIILNFQTQRKFIMLLVREEYHTKMLCSSPFATCAAQITPLSLWNNLSSFFYS